MSRFWYIFYKLEDSPPLRLYRRLREPPAPNLFGDRDIEHSWVAANLPEGPGRALDFGCGNTWMGLLAARKGFEVIASDLEAVRISYEHPACRFVKSDIRDLDLPVGHFDLIINCSAIEHAGLAGRYGVREMHPEDDLNVMKRLRHLLNPSGRMLLTVPVGKDAVFVPLHRVYGRERLGRLLEGWRIEKKEYWTKDGRNRWVMTEESEALIRQPVAHCYGLGLFLLRGGNERGEGPA